MSPESFITNLTETSDSDWQPVSGADVIGLGENLIERWTLHEE